MKGNRQYQNEIGKWIARFLNDDLKAAFLRYDKAGLLHAADLAGVDLQGSPHDDCFLPPLHYMKGNALIWQQRQLDTPEFSQQPPEKEAVALTHMLIELEGVRSNIIIVLDHISQNRNEGGKLLRGLSKVPALGHLLELRSDSVVQTGFGTKGGSFQLRYQLKYERAGEYPGMHRWDGFVAHLFIELMQSEGWKRLKACVVCGRFDMKTRDGWQTCKSSCRVKHSSR